MKYEYNFYAIMVWFLCGFGVVLVRFWCGFCVVLVWFWCGFYMILMWKILHFCFLAHLIELLVSIKYALRIAI